jgi:hypothetical protein
MSDPIEEDPEGGIPDWTPEKEKRTDPDEILRRAEAMMERVAPQFVPSPLSRFSIQRIKNGFLMTGDDHMGPTSLEFFVTEEDGVKLFLAWMKKLKS